MIVDAGRLSEALDAGATLPASWYADPAIHRLELERIFARSWQCVGRTDQVADAGAFLAAAAGHVPVVVVRDQKGVLRGFVNVCRHRGHLVAEGCGRRETLQCPYHAWTYDLDGALRRAPRSEREPGFDPDLYSLLPVSVDTFGPLVFCNPDPGADPLADTLGDLSERIAEDGLDLDAVRFRERQDWEVRANWKVGLENYLECYHCPVAHPGFSKVIDVDPDAYVLEAHSAVLSQVAPVRDSARADGAKVPYVPEGPVERGQYHVVWPNLTLNVEPGPANVSVDVWRPVGPDRTVGHTDYFFGEDVSEGTAREIIAFSSQVGAEDDALVESVQRGLVSGMVPHGRLLLSSEHLIQHFQRLVLEALAAEPAAS
jgi:choline monooxygenase